MEAAEIHLILGPKKKSVAGDSLARSHEDTIDIDDWQWGLKLKDEWAKGPKAGQKGSGNHSAPTILTLKKRVDRSSTSLMAAVVRGETYTEATIHMLHRVQKGLRMTIKMWDVMVSDYDVGVTDEEGGVSLNETIILTYDKVRIEYQSRAGLADDKKVGVTRTFDMKLSW
ncbi:MAG: Hcp1 family type secretion system effector [Rhizobacter sp.]|nr:Hcp1 family type secretion system effector [Rhizobacter sp.]